jgi:hypothetical protein
MKTPTLFKHVGALAVIAPLIVGQVSANGLPITTTVSASETFVFFGLQWNFGSSTPEMVLGARYTESNSDDDVFGAKFDVSFPFDPIKWKQPAVRLMGIGGNCHVQGELGLGLSFADMKPFVAAGAQAPYVNGGVNLGLETLIQPYLGLNSLAAPNCATTSNGPV